MGNIHSVTKSLESLGEEIILIKNFNDSKLCKAIILPGVGAFDPAMNNLINTDLVTDLKNWIKSGKSFFGICLGLQLLIESSDEGKVQGLGILKGKIQKIPNIVNQRIPHMGWCQLLPTKKNTLLNLAVKERKILKKEGKDFMFRKFDLINTWQGSLLYFFILVLTIFILKSYFILNVNVIEIQNIENQIIDK